MSETPPLTDLDFERAVQPEAERERFDLEKDEQPNIAFWDRESIRDDALRLATSGRVSNEYQKTPNAYYPIEVIAAQISGYGKGVVAVRHYAMEKDSSAIAA